MTTFLALDLALVGPTGWVVWDTERDDPVVDYGTFMPKSGEKQSLYAGWDIYNWLLSRLTIKNVSHVAYEITDWHRSLTGKGKNFNVEYAMERSAQRNLGRAETAVVIAATLMGKAPYPIGANEAKKEFGALRKDACARLFSHEYPRFKFIETAGDNEKEYLIDGLTGEKVPHHVSDAFVIAEVVGRRLKTTELISQGQRRVRA